MEHGDSVENSTKEGDFYKDAADYWSKVPPTVDGMLGGYGFISSIDINGSTHFLKQLFRLRVPPGKSRALDCGAGIGRVTKNLLFNHFEKVDLVEQNPAFVAQARASLQSHDKMGNFYCSGLQDFIPGQATYDVIWCQWVLGHLKDEDLIAFLHGCKKGLKKNGVIVLKENTTSSGTLDKDTTDSSLTRPLDHICLLLQQSGLRCVKQRRQEKFPNGLYPVYMIATRPSQEGNVQNEKCSADDMCGEEIVNCERQVTNQSQNESEGTRNNCNSVGNEKKSIDMDSNETFRTSRHNVSDSSFDSEFCADSHANEVVAETSVPKDENVSVAR